MPRFSVVVPAYNASATLRETLDSIAGQEFRDWECIVVDDGSTDETAEIAHEYAERNDRFRVISQMNAGTAGAYTTGLSVTEADLLVICSADDWLLPAHLRAMDELIRRNPCYDLYSSNGFYYFEWSGDLTPVYTEPEWQRELSLSFDDVLRRCFFSVGAVFRRRVLDMTGGHRRGVYVEDYDLWLRAMVRGARHFYTPEALSVHRVSDYQQTADTTRLLKANIEVYRSLLDDAEHPPPDPALVSQRITETESMMCDVPINSALEQQSRALRLRVERLVGRRFAPRVLAIIHAVSWIIRPMRRALLRLRLPRND